MYVGPHKSRTWDMRFKLPSYTKQGVDNRCTPPPPPPPPFSESPSSSSSSSSYHHHHNQELGHPPAPLIDIVTDTATHLSAAATKARHITMDKLYDRE